MPAPRVAVLMPTQGVPAAAEDGATAMDVDEAAGGSALTAQGKQRPVRAAIAFCYYSLGCKAS